ncbi:dimethyl sulfoxide reductase anchor subunit [Sphingomonas koreensis]|nr:dimethyl sulfoxide reductase anchor subunit [Sphingomonas koreensis]
MRPAYSVIFFTVASGAGYGLLFWLGLAAAAGLLPDGRWFALVSIAVAVVLVSTGLVSSAAHLGRPERAWRAFSQWRTSWLSREGVASVVTYVPVAAFALCLLVSAPAGWIAAAGLVSAIGAASTVWATSMIYASLKPVREWHQPLTPWLYLIHAAMTGAVLINGLLHLFGGSSAATTITACSATAAGALTRAAGWRSIDRSDDPGSSLADATGLGDGGAVRSIQWPHSERNYLVKEMGFRIARKHALKLRVIVALLAYVLPMLGCAVVLATSDAVAAMAAVAALLVQLAGMLIERWLFFAEATHTVTLYYGYREPG